MDGLVDGVAGTRAGTEAPNAQALEEKILALEKRVAELEERWPEDRVAIIVFSGDLDRALAAFIIATGAAAMGQQVTMFFTFWGLAILRKQKRMRGKSFSQKMMAAMSPGSSKSLPVSKMNYFGMGAKMLRGMMIDKNVNSLEQMIEVARELGVRMVACEMSRDLMGIAEEEMVGGMECGGVATYLGEALKARASLFI